VRRTFRHDLPVRDAPPPRRLTLALALRPTLRVHGPDVQKLSSQLPGHVGGRGDRTRGVRVARHGFAHGPVRGARGGWRRPRGFGWIGIVLHGVEQRPRRRRFRRRATAEGDEETPPATGASGRTRRGRGVGGGRATTGDADGSRKPRRAPPREPPPPSPRPLRLLVATATLFRENWIPSTHDCDVTHESFSNWCLF
jgi:hypothetical protein